MTRDDLMHHLQGLPITSIIQTGVTMQGVIMTPGRSSSEFTTGERVQVEEITVTWSQAPTAEQLNRFARSCLNTLHYRVTFDY